MIFFLQRVLDGLMYFQFADNWINSSFRLFSHYFHRYSLDVQPE